MGDKNSLAHTEPELVTNLQYLYYNPYIAGRRQISQALLASSAVGDE